MEWGVTASLSAQDSVVVLGMAQVALTDRVGL